jgi:hypothetical protein
MKQRNKPSARGRVAGKVLAGLVDAAIDEWRGHGFIPVRCKSCAFREGTFANQCEGTVGAAAECLTEQDNPFLCHAREGICGGFILVKATLTGEPT